METKLINIVSDLNEIIQVWEDALQQHRNLAKLLKEQNGRTDCIPRGLIMAMSSCIADIKAIIKHYKE